MKRIMLLVAVAAMAVLTLSPAAQAHEERLRFVEIPLSGEAFNPCTGEALTFEGTLHIINNSTEDNAGGYHTFSLSRVHTQGVSDSGAKYTSIGVTPVTTKYGPDDSAYTFTASIKTRLIRQGEDGTTEDFKYRLVTHVTRNANGEFTAQVRMLDIECN